MNSFRESLTSIPGAVTSFLSDTASVASSYINYGAVANMQGQNDSSLSSRTPSPTTTESNHSYYEAENSSTGAILISEKSLPIPASLVKEQWRLIFTEDANASIKDYEEAISHAKDLVLLSEENSDERRWLVRHLVDLRYSLEELQEKEQNGESQSGPLVKTVVGHHFVAQKPRGVAKGISVSRNYCDHCTGIIWILQASFVCFDCHYMVHQKCVNAVVRICAHVITSERQYPITEICPEIGLAAQKYKCVECSTLLNFKNSWIEPRLCDYSGLYFCPSCHWNDQSIIPARVVHNWDFVPRKVSRASLQEIQLFLDKPLIKLEEANPKLFVFLEKLATLKKIRQNLVYMRKYLAECHQAAKEKLLENQIGSRRHLIQSNEFYSINDMEQTENGSLAEFLHKTFNIFNKHIRNCSLCTAKAYICEICSNNEVIFPFDDGCVLCSKCNSIYHRVCMTRKNMICPKCVRLEERRLKMESSVENQNGINITSNISNLSSDKNNIVNNGDDTEDDA